VRSALARSLRMCRTTTSCGAERVAYVQRHVTRDIALPGLTHSDAAPCDGFQSVVPAAAAAAAP
jgi:hypothetical protein